MNLERFFAHHGLVENPFRAEEARHDPVFERLIQSNQSHPDFEKIIGQIDRPSAAVVFGEKGSGKTAIRLKIGRCVAEHNAKNPAGRTLLVAYDDLNPVLDRVVQRRGREMGARDPGAIPAEEMLGRIRLEDHQDAILSLAVTSLNDALLGDSSADAAVRLPADVDRLVRKLSRQARVDWAVLSLLYDQPRAAPMTQRWRRLLRKLHLGWRLPMQWTRLCATVLGVIAAALYGSQWVFPGWIAEQALVASAGILAAAALVLFGWWGLNHLRLWTVCRRLRRQMPAVDRSVRDLRRMLLDLRPAELAGQPWPVQGITGSSDCGSSDSRYHLTRRLLAVLEPLGYSGVMVLVDRVDEPQLVGGRSERIKPVVWPMLDNKFLQQDRVGVKLLLPIEIRHLVRRESSDFFQEARLDKQNLIDRLDWSGPTLYDLCTARLRACKSEGSATDGTREVTLTDLFESEVTRQYLVDILEQMHQPRDAFKLLYGVIQDHCRMIPDDQPVYLIPRTLVETARRQQAQRLQELQRGLSPA